jgi:hypothetical protein
MNRAVWKYEVEVKGTTSVIYMPRAAVIVHVGHQSPAWVTFWAEVDQDAPLEQRVFQVVGTGHRVRDGLRYVGTTMPIPDLVWHLYEVAP